MRRLVALLLVLAAPVAAQSNPGPASPDRDRGWFAFGLGPAVPYQFVAAATANLGRTRFLQVGFHSNVDFGVGFPGPGPVVSTTALHVGPGLSHVSRHHRLALAAGPSVAWGRREFDDDESRFATVGLVVSGQAIVTPVPELGLGLDAFVNVNPVRSGAGVAVTFVFEGNK